MPQTMLMGTETGTVLKITNTIFVCSVCRDTHTNGKFKNLYVNAPVDGREDL